MLGKSFWPHSFTASQWSDDHNQKRIKEYIGRVEVTAQGFTGIAYIYSVVGTGEETFYTFLFEATQGA